MSKLLELKARIEKLPQLQKQKLNNVKVASFTISIGNAYQDVMDCVERRKCFLAVFPDAKLRKTNEAVKQSRTQATRLIEKLKEDFDEIGKSQTDNKITRIRERNNEASDQINKDWKKRLQEELKPLIPLVEIVKEAALPGNEKIIQALESLQSKTSLPPESIEQANEIGEFLVYLRQSLGDLDLEGPGGEFLKKAVKGRANAKDLLNKEVQEFLDEKDLWGILTVNVG